MTEINSVAIVTGASSGIGEATALRLARDFSALTLVARRGGELAAVGERVKAIGAEPLPIETDLGVPEAAKEVVRKTLNTFGRLNALVNIAGAVPARDLFDLTEEDWTNGAALKFHGARRLALHSWDALKSTRGSVVFISGNAADDPTAAQAAVATINAAIEALAKAFADRGMADGVQVNSVSPGAIMTGRRQAILEKAAADAGIPVVEAERRFLKRAGISRFGTADEIANLMAFVVSPQAHWLTGTTIRMDGGEVRSL
jgi:3-oxoacyl-[acyl-carrier protein] reductase